MKKVQVIRDIEEYRTIPPLTVVLVDYETVKIGFKACKKRHPELRDVTEEDFFRMLYKKITESYDLTEKIQLCMHKKNGAKEHIFDGGTPTEKERLALERWLENAGFKTIYAQNLYEYFATLSFNLIDAAFKNNLDEVILVSCDIGLGDIILALKATSNGRMRWEIWKFEGFIDRCYVQKLLDEGIKVRNLDYVLFSSLLKS